MAAQSILTMICSAAALLVSPARGWTDANGLDFPVYLSSKKCDTLGRLGDRSLRDSCVQLDEHQKELLQSRWSDVPDHVKKICIQRNEAARAIEGYASLASCVSDEIGRSWLNGELKIAPR